MEIKKIRIGKKEVFPFTIPSGIITTEASALERIANEIPEIGILTTKSIGIEPREGNREPVIAQYAHHCFTNAVGLTNPGAREFAKKLKKIKIPKDKFLMVSVFGKDADEFAEVVGLLEILGEKADGFELNLSCPHAEGYGMQLGQDPKIVSDIVKAVKNVTEKPVFAKLTPNAYDIGEIAQAAVNAGAYGITAINTVGPGAHVFDGYPVLTNIKGGLSGRGITPVGIRCVSEIRNRLPYVPIIGCGGIYTANDVLSYAKAGANAYGIGSALAGMNETELKRYFSALAKDIERSTDEINDFGLIKSVDMDYKKFRVKEKVDLSGDFHIIKLYNNEQTFKASAGQFVFAWLPEKGEKPFSVMDATPLTIGFLERGCFTKKLAKAKEGEEIYIRGPYGNEIPRPFWAKKVVLVGGGCGIAGLYLFAKEMYGYTKHSGMKVQMFAGAKDKEHMIPLNEIKKYVKLHVATEDGSLGYKGNVADLLGENLKKADFFVNCGPRPMIDAVVEIEKQFTSPERIYSSIDYMTRCGIGICGSCADEKGFRTCVEGPFMPS